MNKKAQKIIIIIFALLVLLFVGKYFFKKNIGSVNIPGKADVIKDDASIVAGEKVPFLKAPQGMQVTYFAKNVPGARVIEFDPKARLIVSQTSEGKIVALTDDNYDGVAEGQVVLASGLKKPHGLAMHCADGPCYLYVAEQDALSRYLYDADKPLLGAKEKLIDISSSSADRHYTRSLTFLAYPDQDTLLISVGSSCDVCEEKGDNGSVLSYNIKTGKKEVYAKGLRNATYLTLSPVSGKVYASEMGRDTLGDDLPPDEINMVEKGKNYGWPICYGKNIHDTKYDKNTYIRNPCMEPFETPSLVDLQAHSAPLGLGFIPEEGWPEIYWYDLLVAYHGSWNRSVPTGYKIVRLKMNAKGTYSGTEDFITGWLSPEGKKLGRPAEIKVLSGGTMYISDDLTGVIYRVSQAE